MILMLFSLGAQANRKSRNCAPVTFVGTSFMFCGPGKAGTFHYGERVSLAPIAFHKQSINIHKHTRTHIYTHTHTNKRAVHTF